MKINPSNLLVLQIICKRLFDTLQPHKEFRLIGMCKCWNRSESNDVMLYIERALLCIGWGVFVFLLFLNANPGDDRTIGCFQPESGLKNPLISRIASDWWWVFFEVQ